MPSSKRSIVWTEAVNVLAAVSCVCLGLCGHGCLLVAIWCTAAGVLLRARGGSGLLTAYLQSRRAAKQQAGSTQTGLRFSSGARPCSAVRDQTNKLMLRSGPAEAALIDCCYTGLSETWLVQHQSIRCWKKEIHSWSIGNEVCRNDPPHNQGRNMELAHV